MMSLINNLIKGGYLKSDSIIKAFLEINRKDFLPWDLEREANLDIALPIDCGQTNSQPTTVAIMLELLDARAGHNVLDIGSGSGWATALLCHIVGEKGRVTAIERIGKLMEWGKSNVGKYNYLRENGKGIAKFYAADGSRGFQKNAPYDRILVSAGASSVPQSLKNQLKIGGKMVIPIGNNLCYLEKKSQDDFYEENYPGFAFVPLV